MTKENILELIQTKNAKIAIGVILFLGFTFLILKKDPKPVEISIVKQDVYRQILSVQGKTKVKELYTAYSPVNGVMRRVELHAGDKVSRGMTLLTIDWDIVKTVKASANGQILKVYRESAGPVIMGERILDYGDVSKIDVSAFVLSEDMPDLDKKDKVLITGFGEHTLEGQVSIIEPSAITKISSLGVEEQRVPIFIEFNPPPGIGDGYELECKIILFEKPNAIVIPTSALFREDGKWAVFTVEKKKAKLRFVEVEHQSEGISMIKSGLSVGESVILYPGDTVENGTKVMPE
ncbi:efflux RND transporter periplasmic adaptor subunit [Leptospira bandrabouensis]|uniref:Efflux RND transporter periplasmic adaptor subunit n=1 Tax=Leptospira bandrabouensis TaxID=2484903 RepID=A0A6H3NV77_9LEPT|nr:efflux RND transporter periplasmic adaptor subunit [Leptospira bandrabouensis]MCG6153969.1 efflux RND transporter periplasmic adaptor subunit [Leptospira bandrabouensis]TGN06708.1 efflux RND transporter periplasmic adaptor subunit [Leptospira bandrabouensis]TGN13643.1 efflux RND transporter periplasmic adaptor subunit [Leptospira bandrabouensis]